MKVLVVCSKNSGRVAPFIVEQAESLERMGIKIDYFTIEGKGLKGYLKNRKHLMDKINSFQPQLIHAHYGLSGLLANTQRNILVVTTYHGSDINSPKVYPFSRLCMMLSAHNIFVSEKNQNKANLTPGPSPLGEGRCALIPCGVDINLFVPMGKPEACKLLGLNAKEKYILFAGAFHNTVKNAVLAKSAMALLPDVHLIELKGFTRQQVAVLMNAVNAVLMTSFTEGSPQFIKEAMACNCPIVSVPVGDVPDAIKDIDGCFISTYKPNDVAEKLKQALEFEKRTEGRNRIIERGLDAETVAKRIMEVYTLVISDK